MDTDTPGRRALRHLQALAKDIGPRPACGAGEQQAHAYAARVMQDWAARVTVEPFRSWTTFSWPFLLIGSLVVFGALATVAGMVWTGLMATLLGTALFVGFTRHVLEVGRLFRQRESRNVLGVIPAGRPPQSDGQPQRRLVLAAHADSSRSALFWHPTYGRYFLVLFQAMAAAILLLPLLAFASLFETSLLPQITGFVGLPVLLGVAVLVHREIRGVWVPGANDNASGVAVSLAVGEVLAKNPLEHTEVWLVVTGCEEVGQAVGMSRFCEAHPEELADADVVVVDMVGSGRLAYETAEGLLGVRPCDPGIVQLMGEIADQHPDWGVKGWVVPVYNDTQACLVRGLRAGTLGSDSDAYRPYHWPTDDMDHIDPPVLEQACTFLLEFAAAFDKRSG